MFYLSLGVAILSSVLYHVFQKSIAPGVHPVVSIMVTYVAALALSLPLFSIFPMEERIGRALSRVNWASFALALAIVGLEVGFLLAYRAGWNMSVAGIAANAAAALVLLPLGMTLFKEKPSVLNVVGVLVCILGLMMVNHRVS